MQGAKPAAKAYKLFDGGGLFLFVSPTGGKSWRVAYRLAGRPKTKSLGSYPDVSLAEAREKLADLKAALRDGKDPMAGRHKKDTHGTSFAEACRVYWDGRHDVSAGYRANALRGLEMHLFPALGGCDVGNIGRDDLLAALRVMDTAGKHVYVRKVRMWAAQVMDWAVENGLSAINPAAMIRPEKAFGRAKVESSAALELREVPEFLRRLGFERELNSVLACRMLALMWVRTVELQLMEWSEIDGDTWIILAGKMKRRRDHLAPLSRQFHGESVANWRCAPSARFRGSQGRVAAPGFWFYNNPHGNRIRPCEKRP